MGKPANAKRWKAVTMDWTDLQSYDHSEQLAVCLTQREAAILKALLTTAYWDTRWTNLTATADELEEFVANIDSQLDGNDCEVCEMQFRDNPADPCEVQYRNSATDPWITMFRKDICPRPSSTTDITQIYNDIDTITTNNATYAGDIINIAPKWAYVDPDSSNALCWAVGFYVDMICDFAIQQIQSENVTRRDANDWWDDMAAIIAGGIIATIAVLATSPITIPVIAVSAFTWAVSAAMDALWDALVGISYTEFEDLDARDDIKCAMFQAMEGATPQYPQWRDSLNTRASFGGAQLAIANAVHSFNQDVDIYVNYMLSWEELNDIAATLPVCPCPARWSHKWDFVTHGQEAWWITDFGHFENGVGFVGDTTLIVGRDSNWINYIKLSDVVPRCDRVKFTSIRVRGTWDANRDAMVITYPPEPDEVENSGWFTTGTSEWTSFPALGTKDWITIWVRSCYTETTDYGSVIITDVTLEGEGVDPFAGRETS